MKKNLEIGKTYPSVKAMCEILEMIYKDSTDSRKANLKEIECHYQLEKQGRKYKVLLEYNTPKEKIDKRKNNGGHVTTTKYGTLLDQLFLDWLVDESINGNAITTRNQLFIEENGIINIPLFREGYKEFLQMGYEEFAKKQDMSKGLVLTYSQKVRKITETSLETVLNRLQRKNVVKWQKNIMVKYFIGETEIADEELEAEIIEAEHNTYENLNMKPFERVNPKMNKKFMNAVCSNFNDISSYWKVYNIDILNDEVVANSLLEDQQRIDMTNELIILYINSTNKAVKNKKSKETTDDKENRNIFGKKNIEIIYKPYASPKYVDDINKLNRLIWLVPEGYKTESEEFIEAFAEFSEDISFDDDDIDNLPW